MSNLSLSNTQPTNEIETQQFLKFDLDLDIKAMLPIKQITEVLKIQRDRIVPLPQMPSWVMGVYNWRGDILWTIDLGHFMGFTPWYQRDTNFSDHNAIILSPYKNQLQNNSEKNLSLGLVINQIEDLENCNLHQIQAPDTKAETSSITNYLIGYWLQADGEIVSVLNGQKIIAAMPNIGDI